MVPLAAPAARLPVTNVTDTARRQHTREPTTNLHTFIRNA